MDMDELDDDNTIPLQPAPQSGPKPLPRMWKDEDDEEGETRPIRSVAPVNPPRAPAPTPERPKTPAPLERTGSSKPKPKARVSDDDGEPRKGKLEETPLLDTYDTRKRVRVVFGIGIGLVALSLIVFGLKMLGGKPEEDVLVDEGAAVERKNADAQDRDEEEAKTLFANARQVAVNGKVNDSRAMLEKLIKSYPKTVAAREAKEALDRPSKNLPMFLDVSSTVVAAPTEPAPKPDAPKDEPAKPTLLANAPPPSASGSGDAVIFRPSNAPDSSKPNMLKKDATPGAFQPPQPVGKPIPAGFQPRTEAGLDPSGYPREIVSDRDGATMVFIPGGTFQMGSDSGDPAERPAHPVTLTPYYIDQHEVTVKQFALYTRETSKRVVDAGPPASAKALDPQTASNFPIVNINARDARDYCGWAGKRLPTEAQWEMAARTTDGRIYPSGNTPPAWPRPRQSRQVEQVMSFENDRSPYNVYDLAGNAWEWTMDYFDSKYYQQVAKGATNPSGPLNSRFRPALVTVKGGSKTFHASWREGLKVDTKLPYVGFRGVLILPDASAPVPPGGPATASPAAGGTNPPPPPSGNTSAPVPF